MAEPKITDEQIADAFHDTYGNVTEAAKLLGITARTIHRHVNANPDLAAIRDKTRQLLVDLAEDKLRDQINKGNIAAIIFTLKTQGRDRGWDENRKPQQANTGKVTIVINEGKHTTVTAIDDDDNDNIIDQPPGRPQIEANNG